MLNFQPARNGACCFDWLNHEHAVGKFNPELFFHIKVKRITFKIFRKCLWDCTQGDKVNGMCHRNLIGRSDSGYGNDGFAEVPLLATTVMEALRRHGIEEKTLIFFIGDNGAPLKIHKLDAPGGGPGWDGSLNDPLCGEKGMLAEGGIRVPFGIAGPGIEPGSVTRTAVSGMDILPTLADLVGIRTVSEVADGPGIMGPYPRRWASIRCHLPRPDSHRAPMTPRPAFVTTMPP